MEKAFLYPILKEVFEILEHEEFDASDKKRMREDFVRLLKIID